MLSRKITAGYIISIIILSVLMIFVLVPIYWLISSSLKLEVDQFSFPPVLIPSRITLEHYSEIFSRDIGRYFFNSFIAASFSSTLALSIGMLVAYAIARFKYPRNLNWHLFLWFISARMFPPIAQVIPFVRMFDSLNLLDSISALIIIYCVMNTPFVILIMMGYIREIPKEIEELGMLEGLTRLGTLGRVVIPLLRVPVGVTWVFCFMLSWNEFLFAIIIGQTKASFTMPVAVAQNITQYFINWGAMSAAGVLTAVPVLLMAFCIQRYLLRGVSLGLLKG